MTVSVVSTLVTGQLLGTIVLTTVGEGGRKCPLRLSLLMLSRRRGNKLTRANQVDHAWRWLAVGSRGSRRFWQPPRGPSGPNVYHTKLLESPSPLTSTLYTHNTAI